MSSFKKLIAQMSAAQVPKVETEEPIAPEKNEKGKLPRDTRQQGRPQQAPRPKTQRKQSQKGG